MRFTLTIECDNAAFGESVTPRQRETVRVLRAVAERIAKGGDSDGKCMDANGNTVGRFGFEE